MVRMNSWDIMQQARKHKLEKVKGNIPNVNNAGVDNQKNKIRLDYLKFKELIREFNESGLNFVQFMVKKNLTEEYDLYYLQKVKI